MYNKSRFSWTLNVQQNLDFSGLEMLETKKNIDGNVTKNYKKNVVIKWLAWT